MYLSSRPCTGTTLYLYNGLSLYFSVLFNLISNKQITFLFTNKINHLPVVAQKISGRTNKVFIGKILITVVLMLKTE